MMLPAFLEAAATVGANEADGAVAAAFPLSNLLTIFLMIARILAAIATFSFSCFLACWMRFSEAAYSSFSISSLVAATWASAASFSSFNLAFSSVSSFREVSCLRIFSPALMTFCWISSMVCLRPATRSSSSPRRLVASSSAAFAADFNSSISALACMASASFAEISDSFARISPVFWLISAFFSSRAFLSLSISLASSAAFDRASARSAVSFSFAAAKLAASAAYCCFSSSAWATIVLDSDDSSSTSWFTFSVRVSSNALLCFSTSATWARDSSISSLTLAIPAMLDWILLNISFVLAWVAASFSCAVAKSASSAAERCMNSSKDERDASSELASLCWESEKLESTWESSLAS